MLGFDFRNCSGWSPFVKIRGTRMAGICLLLAALFLGQARAAELEEVAKFANQQVTGVAVSKGGRVFVNFPDWSDDPTISVAEISGGAPEPYPNAEMNGPGAAGTHFVCVQ